MLAPAVKTGVVMIDHKSPFAVIPYRAIVSLSGTELRFLAALAVHADENRTCFPSQGRLAAMLGVSRQRVSKVLKDLEQKGFVDSQRSKRCWDGAEDRKIYQILFDQPPTPATPEVAPPATSEVAPPATPEVAPINRPPEQTNRTDQPLTRPKMVSER